MNTRRLTVATTAALALTGCQDPYRREAAPPTRTTSAHQDEAPQQEAVVRAFASRWINWTWQMAGAQQRALARLATPELARQLRANASSARIDATLARDRPGSRGRVLIVRFESGGHALVLTRERSYTDGRPDLGGVRFGVYRLSAARIDGHWRIRQWVPQQ
ncbi:MAG: hypothetical protein JHC95_04685 [Solirubrobacteraceae bacterium]|nr:hypothetical protein [Solirubrobacteraceae bacterium]